MEARNVVGDESRNKYEAEYDKKRGKDRNVKTVLMMKCELVYLNCQKIRITYLTAKMFCSRNYKTMLKH